MSSVWDEIWPLMADTHCHPHDYPNPKDLIEDSIKKNITVHQMSIHPDEYLNNSNNSLYQHRNIHTCLGLYPLEVDLKQKRLAHFLSLLPQTKWVGEIGLDYSIEDPNQREAQEHAFKTILSHCHELGERVLSIHSRRAGHDALNMIPEGFNGTTVFHWYSGPTPSFSQLSENIFFSINTAMIRSRNGKRLLEQLPLSQTLLESDGPYITQQEKPVEPKQLTSVIEALSHRHKLSLLDTAQQLHQNYLRAIYFKK